MTPLDYAAQICYSTRETLQFTYDMAVKYKDVPGVYCEMGVAAGAQIIAMAYGAPNKTIYAFDSFEGIPLPSNRDDQYPGIRKINEDEQSLLPNPGEQKLESSGATSISHSDYLEHLSNSGVNMGNIYSYKGWFEETIIGFNEPIALLRLDGDLYNSTYVCLENLYHKVVEGGIIIIDDWELPGCRWACIEYFGSIGYNAEFKTISNIAYLIK